MGMLLLTTLVAALPLGSVMATSADEGERPPVAAVAGVAGVELAAEAQVSPAPARATARAPGAILRCWQYGRLLFEEEVIDVPDGARHRLRLNDRDRSSLALFEMNGALCSVRRTPGVSLPAPAK